jgi:hypothetical protein
VNVASAWETIRDSNKISAKDSLGYYEQKKHKPWFASRDTLHAFAENRLVRDSAQKSLVSNADYKYASEYISE